MRGGEPRRACAHRCAREGATTRNERAGEAFGGSGGGRVGDRRWVLVGGVRHTRAHARVCSFWSRTIGEGQLINQTGELNFTAFLSPKTLQPNQSPFFSPVIEPTTVAQHGIPDFFGVGGYVVVWGVKVLYLCGCGEDNSGTAQHLRFFLGGWVYGCVESKGALSLWMWGSQAEVPKLNANVNLIPITGLGPSPARWLKGSHLARSHLAREASTAVCAVVESAHDRGA